MNPAKRSVRMNEIAGLSIVGLLALCTVGWAAHAELSGAVIAQGLVAAKNNSKEVQHNEGGIIREIYVTEGSVVEAGKLVARLDDTQMKAKLGIIESQLIELSAEHARLEAERDNADRLLPVSVPSEFAAPGTLEQAIAGQTKHFVSLRETILKKKEQLQEQITQIELGVEGTRAKLAATEKQVSLAESELSVLQALKDGGLTTRNRIFAMERDLAQLTGQAEDLRSNIASQKGQIAEIHLKLLEIDEQRRSQVTGRLSEVRAKISEFYQQRDYELFRLHGTEIAAPISGLVHDLRVHTTSGVIGAGDTLMTIVPSKEALVFRVRVRPQDIDRLYVGQPARLRVIAFNARTTPEVEGMVTVVGADQLVDSATGVAFFRIDIEAKAGSLPSIDLNKMRAGMPVEAFITTEQRTVLSYLFKPVVDQFAKALRES